MVLSYYIALICSYTPKYKSRDAYKGLFWFIWGRVFFHFGIIFYFKLMAKRRFTGNTVRGSTRINWKLFFAVTAWSRSELFATLTADRGRTTRTIPKGITKMNYELNVYSDYRIGVYRCDGNFIESIFVLFLNSGVSVFDEIFILWLFTFFIISTIYIHSKFM